MEQMKTGRARMRSPRERKPRTRRAVVIPVALIILAAVAVAGTIRAFRAHHRPADGRLAVAARIGVAGTPAAIAAGQHAIWVVSAATGTLSRIDPQTDRVKVVGGLRIARHGDISGFAVTRDAVWVAFFGDFGANGTVHGGSLVRVDPGTMQIVARLPISGIVALEPGMGSLWANQIAATPSGTSQLGGPPEPARGSVDRIDPSTGQVHAVLTGALLSPRMVVAGGFVWVYDQQNQAIERVDPRTGSVSRITSEPLAIGAGDVTDSLAYADGGLWFPACVMCPVTGPLSVHRLDVSTGEMSEIPLGISGTTEKIPGGHIERNVGLYVVAADPNSLWLAVRNQTDQGRRGEYWGGRLIRMDLSTRRVQAMTIGFYAPGGVSADGDLWLADGQHHSILRVDP